MGNEPFIFFLSSFLQRLSSVSYKSREEDPSLTEDEVSFLHEIQQLTRDQFLGRN